MICEQCHGDPCSCGWELKDWKDSELKEHIKLLTKILEYKQLNPPPKYPGRTKTEKLNYVASKMKWDNDYFLWCKKNK
jgi:hypothetical protein